MRIWVQHPRSRNVGDEGSSAIRYAKEFFGLPAVEGDLRVDLPLVQSDLFEKAGARVVVVGGTGMLMDTTLAFLHALLWRPPPAPVILWGIGSNYPPGYRDPEYPAWLSNATLVGLRDRGTGYMWTPCPSCLHPAIRVRRAKARSVVVYEHHEAPLPDLGFPKAGNDIVGGVEAAADFLGSAETVITNSYHGAYWATLLGARVVLAGESSTKLVRIRHSWWMPTLEPGGPVEQRISEARVYPDALEESIERNRLFWRLAVQHFR